MYVCVKKSRISVLNETEMLLQEKEGVVIEMPNEGKWMQQMSQTHRGND
jgi:hypothetical protein